MNLFIYFAIFVLTIYISLIISYIIGFYNQKHYALNSEKEIIENETFISLIIPFRNEEKNLINIFNSLKNQSLSPERFEVLFINDYSTDNSNEIIQALTANVEHIKLIQSDVIQGKKWAVKIGISNSKGNLIVTSDADCMHHKNWLLTILNYYILNKPKMIIAPVIMHGSNFFENMQSSEFISLIASTAGSAGIEHPIMCNGANLAYEKKAFLEFEDGLNSKVLSGDDVFLMHAFKKKYPKDIHFLKSREATVYTKAEKSISLFFKQRTRWVSKSKAYKDFDTIFTGITVFFSNLLILCLFILSFLQHEYLKFAILFIIIKMVPDFILMISVSGYFRQKHLLKFFPPVLLIYPFYVVITALAGIIFKRKKW